LAGKDDEDEEDEGELFSSSSDGEGSSANEDNDDDDADPSADEEISSQEEGEKLDMEEAEELQFLREHQIAFKGQKEVVTPSGLKVDITINPEDGTSLMSVTSSKSIAKIKNLSRKEASIKFGACLYKAKKCIESVKQFIDAKDFDNQRFYFHKCLDLYKKALICAFNNEEKARVHF